MSQLRPISPSSRSDDAVASYFGAKSPWTPISRRPCHATAQSSQSSLEEFAAAGRPSIFGAARQSTAFAQAAFSLAAAGSDILVIMVCAMIAGAICSFAFESPQAVTSMAGVGSMAAAMFLVVNSARTEYRFDNFLKGAGQARRCATLWTLTFLCLLAFGFLAAVKDHDSRVAMPIFFIVGICALIAARIGATRLARKYSGRGSALARRVFVVGYADEIKSFRTRHEASTYGLEIVAAFPLRPHGQTPRDIEVAAARARALRPDDVLIIVPWTHKRTIDACVEVFRTLPVAIHLGAEAVLSRHADARISEIGGVLSLSVARRPLSSGELALKRLLDLVGAGASLVALAPLFILVALIIRLDSPGPAFFLQRRYGFNREPFRILKFRTMTTMEDGPCVIPAQRNDPRVTRVGRWLRRYNIDELPQLVNVLRGEMSLVGPRPHASSHDEAFEILIASYARRYNMKPGITGWAQVNGFRGEIRTEDDILRRVEHDLFYLDNWSIWLDFECVCRTVCSARAYLNAY